MIIHPQPLASALDFPIKKIMTSKARTEKIDELVPVSDRGKFVIGTFLNMTCLPLDNGVGVESAYERVTIMRIGGTDKERYARIVWKMPACRGYFGPTP